MYCSLEPTAGGVIPNVTDDPASYQLSPTVGVVVPRLVAIVSRYWVFHVAVAVFAAFIVILFDGESVPEASPVQPLNTYRVVPDVIMGDVRVA